MTWVAPVFGARAQTVLGRCAACGRQLRAGPKNLRPFRRCALREKGGSGHPRRQLPLLPSGPGGVRQLCVAQSQNLISTINTNEQRRERDSNPRYLAVHTISNRAPSATRTSLQ